MFGLGKKQKRLEKIESGLEVLLEEHRARLAEASEAEKRKKEHEVEREAAKNSDEPWVSLESGMFDETKGIELKLDWNEAFIKYLINAGISGRDENQIVQKWLALTAMEQSEKLKTQELETKESTFE